MVCIVTPSNIYFCINHVFICLSPTTQSHDADNAARNARRRAASAAKRTQTAQHPTTLREGNVSEENRAADADNAQEGNVSSEDSDDSRAAMVRTDKSTTYSTVVHHHIGLHRYPL